MGVQRRDPRVEAVEGLVQEFVVKYRFDRGVELDDETANSLLRQCMDYLPHLLVFYRENAGEEILNARLSHIDVGDVDDDES